LNASPPSFFDGDAPESLTAFLETGDDGMTQLRHLHDFLLRFLEDADQYILLGAGFPIHEVKLRAPIPRPRLFFGLVQNSPTAWRNDPARTHLNLIPQGHQRPQGTVIDPGDPIVFPAAEKIQGGWNPELGVIIGRGGRDIPVHQARSHIAGLTIVSDVTFDYFRWHYFEQEPPLDWFEDAMTSWGDKKSDARTPMGPYLVTLDEVGNPYDLMIYTRQSGYLRDRSHTGAMAIGIERTISWLSSFRTLHPGDVIHMGTMGYDGSPSLDDFLPTENDYLESEIERLGVLRNPLVIDHPQHDWRAKDDPARRVHPAPAVRDLLLNQGERLTVSDWNVSAARHFWITFGNYQAAGELEGMPARPYPRFLCAPNTALASSGQTITLPAHAREIQIGCELAFVVHRVASQISVDDADDYILGYTPLVAITDSSFSDGIIEPASMQERNLPRVYARWADGFNVVGQPVPASDLMNRACRVNVDGYETVTGSTAEYQHRAAKILSFISTYITLFPGDVVTLGRVSKLLTLALDSDLIDGFVEIDGLGRVDFQLRSSYIATNSS
jgi:2-keto-4-pentenoate hydratase/2-oxohepta-3-ene-1,7-dioic acid hydratase in catechol pathway